MVPQQRLPAPPGPGALARRGCAGPQPSGQEGREDKRGAVRRGDGDVPIPPPTATVAPAITPPAAQPAVRSAVPKANQCSRSPSAATAKIRGA